MASMAESTNDASRLTEPEIHQAYALINISVTATATEADVARCSKRE